MIAAKPIEADIAQIDRWLAQPDCGFAELRGDVEFLGSVGDTRDFLIDLREGLEAARDGRVVTHAQIEKDAAERRRRYGPHAAE